MPPDTGRLRLLVRQHCHLCEDARQVLLELGVDFDALDVDEDSRLLDLYSDFVPVLLIDGEELARVPLTRPVIESALRRVAYRSMSQ